MLPTDFKEANFPDEFTRARFMEAPFQAMKNTELQPMNISACDVHGSFGVFHFVPNKEDIEAIQQGRPIWVIINFRDHIGKVELTVEKPDFKETPAIVKILNPLEHFSDHYYVHSEIPSSQVGVGPLGYPSIITPLHKDEAIPPGMTEPGDNPEDDGE